MAGFDAKAFIDGLAPELQEKAKACKSADEFLKLADENDVELPQEALEAVAGGNCADYIPDVLPEGPG